MPHLRRRHRNQQRAAIGHHPFHEVGPQPFEHLVEPVNIVAGQSPFHPASDLGQETFVLRHGLSAMTRQNRLEAGNEFRSLLGGQVEIVIGLPSNQGICMAIGKGNRRATGRDCHNAGDDPSF